jgi:phosphoribosyl-ATP pyrophosphohydrolase/phosphoribosyl-AMP cyclohydrolase
MINIDWNKNQNLVPTIVQDIDSNRVLMLAYMNEESWAKTEKSGFVTFFSRSRQSLWTKGETSGHTLKFISAHSDCDGDTILIRARPAGPACHLGTITCFQQVDQGFEFLGTLTEVIDSRFKETLPDKSYVANLARSSVDKIAQKVGEEAVETVIAAKNTDAEALKGEAADLLFHLMVLLRAKDLNLQDIVDVLQTRHTSK